MIHMSATKNVVRFNEKISPPTHLLSPIQRRFSFFCSLGHSLHLQRLSRLAELLNNIAIIAISSAPRWCLWKRTTYGVHRPGGLCEPGGSADVQRQAVQHPLRRRHAKTLHNRGEGALGECRYGGSVSKPMGYLFLDGYTLRIGWSKR